MYMYIYIYIYTYMNICMYVCTYMYTQGGYMTQSARAVLQCSYIVDESCCTHI